MKPEEVSEYERPFTCSLYPKEPQSRAQVLQSWADEQDRCLKEVSAEFEHEFDVLYGPQKCDIWYPNSMNNSVNKKDKTTFEKVHVFTHGGYWIEFTKRSYCSVLRCLLHAGFVVVSVEYTYASKIPLNEVVKQVETAILFTSDKFPNASISISGHSAGGHLTSKALENPNIQAKVHSAVIITAVYEVLPLIGTTVGNEIKLTEEMGKQMNVDCSRVAEFKGDILIISVQHDAPRLKQQSIDFLEKLSKLKSNVRSKHFDEDHFTIVIKMHDIDSDISKTIIQFLKH